MALPLKGKVGQGVGCAGQATPLRLHAMLVRGDARSVSRTAHLHCEAS